MDKVLEKYIRCFENLSESNISNLMNCFSDDIVFIDPFNKLVGKDCVKKMLEGMFKKTKNPRFKIIYSLSNQEKRVIKWRFSCIAFTKAIEFSGFSEVHIRKGKVVRHEDFWDSGKNFYCKIPLIGKIFNKINRG